MSIRVMSAVWDVDLPDSEKIVLLALADCANDEGSAWPSMATIARKCSKSDRTCQAAIKELVRKGHLTRNEVPGKGCNYTVHPVRPRLEMQGYTPPETHYVYRIDDADSGEFYIGVRTCVGSIDDDPYMGSGNWVKEARRQGRALRKSILEVVQSREALAHAEVRHVGPVFGSENCRNAKLPTPGTLSQTGYTGDTPEAASPRSGFAPKRTTQTPEAASDKPSRTIIPSEANASSGKRARATRLPENFQPVLSGKTKAVVDGWPPGMLENELEQFRDRNTAKGETSLDWQASFRTWVRNAEKWRPRDGSKSTSKTIRDPVLRALADSGIAFGDHPGNA